MLTKNFLNHTGFKLNNKLSKKPLLKNKIVGSKNSAGKNNSGKTTIFKRGGGHKRNSRIIQFNRSIESTAIVINIEYDPNRNAYIGAVYDFYKKTYYYILLPNNLKIGDIIKSGHNSEVRLGHAIQIAKIPLGSFIHNISIKKNKKGVFSRAAGKFSILIEKNDRYSRVRLSSGEHRLIPNECIVTLGVVSNEQFFLTEINKAGRSRWLNKRPTVRGVAMNPIDHPHGGGEGKTSGGKIKLTPWGKPTQGRSTSNSKSLLIISKRNKI